MEMEGQMMGKSEYNNFIRDYQTIRDVLKELFIYGCYKDSKIIEKLNISSRKLEKEFQRLHFYTGETERNERNVKHSKIYGFNYDCYKNNNYLYDTYRLKTIEMNYFNRYILILQILNKYHMVEIKNLNQLSDGRLECDSSAINKMINEMVDLGVIERENKQVIKEAQNIFHHLSEEELVVLRTVIELYEKTMPCSVLGYFCRCSIEQYMKQKYKKEIELENTCIFGYDFLYRTLNDEIIYEIMEAIEEKIMIEVEENNKSKLTTIFPLKIIEEYMYGRQYLYGMDMESKEEKCWRIEKIKNIKKVTGNNNAISTEEISEKLKKIDKGWCVGISNKKEETEEVVIEFECEEGEEYILNRVELEKQWGGLEFIHPRKAILRIAVNQSREMIPWIRSFGKYAKVIKGEKLKQELKKSWEEMLTEYESISKE